MTTPGDESRTELAWREIVEHYGERVLPDETDGGTDSRTDSETPGDLAESEPVVDDEGDDPREDDDAVAAVDRFQPPTPPPFPRPRTWQRGVAWAGIFVPPVVALLMGLLSMRLPPLLGWTMLLWFVGSFIYLVGLMPRQPRDPWDDGSRV